MRRLLRLSSPVLLAAAAVALSPPAAHAQFVLQNGTAQGDLQLASYNTVAGGALPSFGPDGVMDEAGGGFAELGAVNTMINDTGLVALPNAINAAANGAPSAAGRPVSSR